ncbi:MAG: hypothetical protein HQL52_02855 [Magnetococcales bacterium]|nr:hypothetical protein [Magnetococcales bacterium]
MTFWNVLVILCFVVLYLGIALVFVQVRRLRDDLKLMATTQNADEDHEELREYVETVTASLEMMERKIGMAVESIPAQIRPDLEALQGEMRFLSRPTESGIANRSETGSSSESANKNDAYREARLLLANGVDEERVIKETGLTVEEVSLLKSFSSREEELGEGDPDPLE